MHNKTVNIISFQMSYNYGSALQSYALKQVLEHLGCNIRFINIKPNCFERTFNWTYEGANKLKESFEEFQYLHFTPSLDFNMDNYTSWNFSESEIFIVGSDQVWNLKYTQERWQNFFLDFVPEKNKKVAYAASFGQKNMDFDANIFIEITQYLKRFKAISCREKDGADFCQNKVHVDAIRVLDPTLLNIDYSSLFDYKEYHSVNKELVFFGFGVDRKLQYEWVKYMGKELQLSVRVINGNTNESGLLYSHYVTPSEWLSIIYNASILVTNSFHAMAFAINFRIPFIIIPRDLGKTFDEMDFSRFESLLSDLELEDRYFSSFEEIQSDHRWKNPIDYDKVYEKLNILKECSLNFLKQALEN